MGVINLYLEEGHECREEETDLLMAAANIVARIIEQKSMSERLRQSEEQLKQAQKIEAIGRLAGGIAHDFNNLMTVVTGFGELLRNKIDKEDHRLNDLNEMIKAGRKAADLTHQLLAFSRKQVLKPEVIDVNAVLEGIHGMLRRLIGEDIELVLALSEEPVRVEADKGHMEQIIMNIAVNARDAMPAGGTLVLETAAVDLDETYAAAHTAVKPGPYVRIAVTDTGKRTTFKVYLPRVSGKRSAGEPAGGSSESHGGSERVLVVEDDEAVRKVIEAMLEGSGYAVYLAKDGEDALRICEHCPENIDLLLSDMVMPRMSGQELAEKLVHRYPELKILFMSGYTDGAVRHHGNLRPKTGFIEKPFSPASLTRKIREVLDRAG
ncbi:MAG: response regulator [Spirochaetota bacterium]